MGNVKCDLSRDRRFADAHAHGDAIAVVRTEGEDGTVKIDVCESCLQYLVSSVDLGAEMTILRHEPIPSRRC
jgi:hypothetical protein